MKRGARCFVAAVLAGAALGPVALGGAQPAQAGVALGAYIPGADHHANKIDAYANEVGRPPLIVNTYKDWGPPPFEPRELEGVWRRGAIPLITWEPWGFPLRRIARGRYDGYIRASARAAVRWGKPIFLRFAHEMNGNWYPWGRGVGARVYKTAWRHLVRLFRRMGARNVIWVWTPYVDPAGHMPFAARYPGNKWVDWVGLDGMNWGGSFRWTSFRQLFARSYRILKRLSPAPMMLAEVGCGEAGGSKARWVSSAMRRQIPRMRRVRALVWWSRDDPRGDLRVGSSHPALQALRSAARSHRYASSRRRLLQASRYFRASRRAAGR